LNPAEVESFVRDILGLARSGQLGGRDSNHARESLARAGASRAAIGAGASLPTEAVAKLLGDLLRCESPHTSPGGRPTFVEIAASEITRRFQKAPDPRKIELD
jgi:DNA mismatch repair protein MutL